MSREAHSAKDAEVRGQDDALISIAELRDAATRARPPLMLTDQSRLLALVEAVEAAQALVAADKADDAALHALVNADGVTDELSDAQAATARGVTDAFARLEEALTRFDFEVARPTTTVGTRGRVNA